MPAQSILGNETTAAERLRLLEQLEELDRKDELALQEREALIGKLIVAAIKNARLSTEDFASFMGPLITKKSDAKKLGLEVGSRASSTSAPDDASPEPSILGTSGSEVTDDTTKTPVSSDTLHTAAATDRAY